jgi:glycosyltransferase involved in cell wall biosynthesis
MVEGLSIIIPSLNEGRSVEIMIPNIIETIGIEDYEIIVINSGGTETSAIKKMPEVHLYESPTQLGECQARNFGVSKASKEYLVFLDAHMNFNKKWGSKFLSDLNKNNDSVIAPCITVMGKEHLKGYGEIWKNLMMENDWLSLGKSDIHEIPFAGGACLAVEKRTFLDIGQFDDGMSNYGSADIELSLRTWLLGYHILCDPSIEVAHQFRSKLDRPYQLEWRSVSHNKLRLAFSHFCSARLNTFLKEYSNKLADPSTFAKLMLLVLERRVLERREALFKNRVNSDDWFFEKFPMNGWE